MQRTQIYIDHQQRKVLKELAREQGVSLSELIRQAIGNFIAKFKKSKKNPLEGIIGIYNDPSDPLGSQGKNHDDIYD